MNEKWTRIDDKVINSLWRMMQHEGINTDVRTIRQIINSDFVGKYDPFLEYVDSLDPWDGTTDYIRQLADMVHCQDTPPEEFCFYLRIWLLAMYASVVSCDAVNPHHPGAYRSAGGIQELLDASSASACVAGLLCHQVQLAEYVEGRYAGHDGEYTAELRGD